MVKQLDDKSTLELLDDEESPKQRGGARKGAGRKAPRGKTIVKRIPEKYLEAIELLISHLDGQRKTNKHASQLNVRNLDDELITLQIQTMRVKPK